MSKALDRVEIGRTGVMVPPIAFGTSALGSMPKTYGYEVPNERARATIEAVLDSASPFLDTSNNYGAGRSEERIGQVLRDRGGLPRGAVISTKLDRDMQTERFDADRAWRSLEESLERLGLDRVDILHLHDPEYGADLDEITATGGALNALMKMKEQGLARAVGLAAGKVDVMMPILRNWEFDALITHNRYTLVNRNAHPMIDLAASRGISVLCAAPYAGGVFAKGTAEFPRYVYQQADDDALDPVRAVEAVCARHDIAPGAAALQFPLREPRVAGVICGVTRPERVAQTLDWLAAEISDDAWEELMALPFTTDDPEASRTYNPG